MNNSIAVITPHFTPSIHVDPAGRVLLRMEGSVTVHDTNRFEGREAMLSIRAAEVTIVVNQEFARSLAEALPVRLGAA